MKKITGLVLIVMLLCCLAACKPAPADGMGRYVITVIDEEGKPVEGVTIQICDEGSCLVATTDAKGTVTHEAALYPYEIHLLKAPEGYVLDNGLYTLPEAGGSVEITLKKQ